LICKLADLKNIHKSQSNRSIFEVVDNNQMEIFAQAQLSSALLAEKSENSFFNGFEINANCLIKSSAYGYFVIFIIANVLIGSSTAPLYTLGTTYIDNHVTKENSSIYLGITYLDDYLFESKFFIARYFRFCLFNACIGTSDWLLSWCCISTNLCRRI